MAVDAERSWKWEPVLSVVLIALVTILAYGVLIPNLGFYRDDWYMIWTAQAQGPQGVMALFKIDRPFIGLLYALDYTLLGKATLHWHLYALLLKLIGGLALFWLLRMIWPERRIEATFVTLLFLLYPGFYQQPNAATFKNLLLAHAAAILSIALTIRAAKARGWLANVLLTVLAVALGLFYLAIYEALIGLEAARLLLLWYIIYQDEQPNLKAGFIRTLKRAIPYLLLAVAFAYWRIFLFQSGRRSTNVGVLLSEYGGSPVYSILDILIEAAKDIVETTFFAWMVPAYQFTEGSRDKDLVASVALAAIVVGLILAYVFWVKRQNWIKEDGEQPSRSFLHFIALGALIILVTTIPIVAAGRDVVFALQWDRYTVQSTLGVALFIGGFAFYALRGRTRWAFLFSLIAVSVITQYHGAVYYRDFWTQERNMWWQLSWRAPDIQPGTTVIAIQPRGYRLAEEYEVWGPLNLIYNPGGPIKVSGQIPYGGIALDLAQGTQEQRYMRSVLVSRDFSKAMLVSMPAARSCAHVINGEQLELPVFEDPEVVDMAPSSRIDLIVAEATPRTPPADVFGAEPEHDWCYYYEKIDLARQRQDWQEAVRLADEAQAKDLTPTDGSEWMPVLEAYVNAGEVKAASQIAKRIKADKNMRLVLCQQLEQTAEWPASYDHETIISVLCGGGG